MKTNWRMYLLIAACGFFAGCAQTTRSISHSGYLEPGTPRACLPGETASDPGFEYKGELSEFDVLGITRGEVTSEAEISRALDNSKRVNLRPCSSILLIQSGAMFPDGPMVTELSKHFTIVPFSGVPSLRKTVRGVQNESFDPENYSKSLRLAAAQGGNDFIVCYWGILESGNEKLATKTVSWVPVVNWIVPDEKQHMRIRLKVAMVDVRSGNWTIFSPQPFDDARMSVSPRRDVVDRKQIERLKKKAYEASSQELVRPYSQGG
jgi:hypothetical protein